MHYRKILFKPLNYLDHDDHLGVSRNMCYLVFNCRFWLNVSDVPCYIKFTLIIFETT